MGSRRASASGSNRVPAHPRVDSQGVPTGSSGRPDVCDAQPELLRVAKNLGRETDTECPICEHEQLVHVMFAFGPGLPPGGLPLTDVGVLSKAARKSADVACYLVEVCTGCCWNHLLSVFAPGRP